MTKNSLGAYCLNSYGVRVRQQAEKGTLCKSGTGPPLYSGTKAAIGHCTTLPETLKSSQNERVKNEKPCSQLKAIGHVSAGWEGAASPVESCLWQGDYIAFNRASRTIRKSENLPKRKPERRFPWLESVPSRFQWIKREIPGSN
jgi:hypothetical protein